jgi:hypothetical protein
MTTMTMTSKRTQPMAPPTIDESGVDDDVASDRSVNAIRSDDGCEEFAAIFEIIVVAVVLVVVEVACVELADAGDLVLVVVILSSVVVVDSNEHADDASFVTMFSRTFRVAFLRNRCYRPELCCCQPNLQTLTSSTVAKELRPLTKSISLFVTVTL